MTISNNNQPAADRSWGEVEQNARAWFVGYDQGREDAQISHPPDESLALTEGIAAGLAITQKQAERDGRARAAWENNLDRLLDEAQRLIREGRTLEAHRVLVNGKVGHSMR